MLIRQVLLHYFVNLKYRFNIMHPPRLSKAPIMLSLETKKVSEQA